MANYKIIGVEHMAGTSKKTGRPYDMDVLYCEDLTAPRNGNVTGHKVDKITISRDSGILTRTPNPGDIYDIGFNRFGYVEYADPVK